MKEIITWISVADRLPDNGDDVLINTFAWIRIAYYDRGDWMLTPGIKCTRQVTHWADMPKGPSDE